MTNEASPEASPPQRTADREGSPVAAKRARKREQDRRSQRLARERTKNRIAHLEGVIAELQQTDSMHKTLEICRQRDKIAADRDALAQTLRSIKQALAANRVCLLPSNTKQHPTKGRSCATQTASDDQATVPTSCSVIAEHEKQNDIFLEPTTTASWIASTTAQWLNNDLPSKADIADPIIPLGTEICDCSPAPFSFTEQAPTFNFWRFANETLVEPPKQSCDRLEYRENQLEDDVPIRAILEGWDSIEQRVGGDLPLSWRKLRLIDETLFPSCRNTERLAILRFMHLLYRYHQHRSPEREAVLPAWFLARPSQSMAHSYAIDYLAWPRLRERFVFHQHKYCTNVFWMRFCSNFRILWPFEFRDCYSFNTLTGEYSVSPVFDERISDLRSWTMSADMFEAWPEFVSDIPIYNPMRPTPSVKLLRQNTNRESHQNFRGPRASMSLDNESRGAGSDSEPGKERDRHEMPQASLDCPLDAMDDTVALEAAFEEFSDALFSQRTIAMF